MKPQNTDHLNHSSPRPLGRIVKTLLLALATAALTTASQAQVPVFTNIWNYGSGTNADAGLPNDLPNTGNNVRGIALSPLTTNVLYASTTAGTNGGNNHVAGLNFPAGGTYLGQLNGTGVSGGTVNLAPVRVSDDGSVYACNVVLAGGTLIVYRWISESDVLTPATQILNLPAVTVRFGDNMDVRGSGMDTEVVITGNGGAGLLILKPAEPALTTWTNVQLAFPGAVSMGARGVAFDGTNNAVYGKPSGSTLVYRIAYDLSVPTNFVTATFNVDNAATAGIDFTEFEGVKLLSAVVYATTSITNTTVHRARVFQLVSPSNAVSVLNAALPLPNFANANGLGMSDIKNAHFVFSEPNNGISVYKISGFVTNTPPVFGGAPTGGGIYVAGYSPVTLAVTASGTAPISYQWYFNTNTAIPGATSNTWSLGAADLTDVGMYSVIATNSAGRATSSLASVSVVAANYSTVASQLWALAPGNRDYLSTGDLQRGMAFDPISESVVLVSRAPTNGVHVLSAATGVDLGELDISLLLAGTPPGFYPINSVAVADDGAVYVANLLLSGASDTFAIYRWQDTTNGTPMSIAYFNNPGIGRLGDTLAARGAGVNTEILASFNSGTNIALFTTGDGANFSFNLIAVTNLPADAQANGFARLGITFGPTNTFWAKSSGFNLRLVRYDVAAGTGEVIASYDNLPGGVAPIGVDNGNNLLGGIAINQIPQNLSLYDLQAAGGPALVDRELYAVNNPNVNGTGAVAFDVAGGRVFSLDSNNGILALNYAPRLYITPEVTGGIVTWTGPGALQASGNVTGTYTNVTGATSPYTNAAASSLFFRVVR